MNLIKNPLLQSGVLEHLAVSGSFLLIEKWLGSRLRSFDMLLALDTCESYLFCGSTSGVHLTFLRFVEYYSLKLFLLVEEVRDVEECIAFESYVYKSRLHPGQHAHHSSLVDVADNALIVLAAFDVKLGNLFVFDDGD